jgi:hypothetical protein
MWHMRGEVASVLAKSGDFSTQPSLIKTQCRALIRHSAQLLVAGAERHSDIAASATSHYFTISKKSSSLSTGTPSSFAFSSFDPADSPATT